MNATTSGLVSSSLCFLGGVAAPGASGALACTDNLREFLRNDLACASPGSVRSCSLLKKELKSAPGSEVPFGTSADAAALALFAPRAGATGKAGGEAPLIAVTAAAN